MEDIIYKSSASRSASASSNEARLDSTLDSTRLVLDRLRLWLGRFSRLNAGDGARAACTREQSSAEPQAAVCLPATQTSFKWHEVSVRYTRSGALAGTLQLASDFTAVLSSAATATATATVGEPMDNAIFEFKADGSTVN